MEGGQRREAVIGFDGGYVRYWKSPISHLLK